MLTLNATSITRRLIHQHNANTLRSVAGLSDLESQCHSLPPPPFSAAVVASVIVTDLQGGPEKLVESM